VTTEGGLEVAAQWQALRQTRERMNAAGIEVSLFIAPEPSQVDASARVGAQFIELHSGAFAEAFSSGQHQPELDKLVKAARQAHELGLKVNAGHGLNYQNVRLLEAVPHLIELNIGHSIVSRAVFVGLEAAVREMLAALQHYPG